MLAPTEREAQVHRLFIYKNKNSCFRTRGGGGIFAEKGFSHTYSSLRHDILRDQKLLFIFIEEKYLKCRPILYLSYTKPPPLLPSSPPPLSLSLISLSVKSPIPPCLYSSPIDTSLQIIHDAPDPRAHLNLATSPTKNQKFDGPPPKKKRRIQIIHRSKTLISTPSSSSSLSPLPPSSPSPAMGLFANPSSPVASTKPLSD